MEFNMRDNFLSQNILDYYRQVSLDSEACIYILTEYHPSFMHDFN